MSAPIWPVQNCFVLSGCIGCQLIGLVGVGLVCLLAGSFVWVWLAGLRWLCCSLQKRWLLLSAAISPAQNCFVLFGRIGCNPLVWLGWLGFLAGWQFFLGLVGWVALALLQVVKAMAFVASCYLASAKLICFVWLHWLSTHWFGWVGLVCLLASGFVWVWLAGLLWLGCNL